jgi:hypothetical protein
VMARCRTRVGLTLPAAQAAYWGVAAVWFNLSCGEVSTAVAVYLMACVLCAFGRSRLEWWWEGSSMVVECIGQR